MQERLSRIERGSSAAGVSYMVLAAFLFALISIVAKILYESGLTEKNITPITSLISAGFSLCYNLVFNREKILLEKDKVRHMVYQGIFGSAVTTLFFYKSLYLIDAAICVMILFTNPVFVFLYYALFKRERFNKKAIAGLLTTMVGIAMVIDLFGVAGVQMNKMGIIYGVIASMSYAYTSINVQENLSDQDPFVITMYTNLIAGAILIMTYGAGQVFAFKASARNVLGLLELGTVSGLLPMVLVYSAIRKIGAYKVSLIGTLELPITAVLGFFILKEYLSAVQIAGIILVFFGVLNVERK